jgi:DNA/RNA endonuclease YhcR with UshA esterase domain
MSGRSLRVASAVGLGLIAILNSSVVPASAHHSFAAEYDANRPVTVTGTVTKVEWTNPHARLFVDVKDESGKVNHWDFELGPPNGLMRRGWNRNSLKPGHVVVVTGFHSKTEAFIANARTVSLTDGRQLFAGSSFDPGPVPETAPSGAPANP